MSIEFTERVAHGKKFHESLIKAKDILELNQYPPNFFKPIISATIEKIVKSCTDKDNNNDADNENSPAKVNLIIQCWGLHTDNSIKQLNCSNAPMQSVVTLLKQKTFLLSLEENLKEELRSSVVSKTTCPACHDCYVDKTSQHMITRFKKHFKEKKQTCQKAFWYMYWRQITNFWCTNISIIKPRNGATLDPWSIMYKGNQTWT